MIQKPSNSPCSRCFMAEQKLCSGFSTPEGTGAIPLLFVAEALGEHELREGLPLRPNAPAGSTFEKALRDLGYDRASFTTTSVLRGQPKYNKLAGADYEHAAIRACLPYLEQTIAEIKPRIIVALGEIPFRALTGLTGKDFKPFKVRGYFFWSEKYNAYVLPTFHPSFIIRGENQYFPIFKSDINKAIKYAIGEISAPEHGNYRIVRSTADINELLEEVRADQNALIAIDIETGRSSLGIEEDKLLSIMRNDDDFSKVLPAAAGEIVEDSDEDDSVTGDMAESSLDAILHAYEMSTIESVQFSLRPGTGWFIPYHREFLDGIREILASPNPKVGHNCFHAHTSVWMEDGTWQNIRNIKIGDKVRTVKDGRVVSRDVIDTVHMRDDRPWIQVHIDGAYNRGTGRWGNTGVICTPDHEWILSDGSRKRADQLNNSDLVFVPRQGDHDLIFGSLLGDGHVRADQPIFTVGHTNLNYTLAKLSAIESKLTTRLVHTGYGTSTFYSFTLTVPKFWRDAFYADDGSRKWVQPTSAAQVAIWYGDDGTLAHGRNATIAIHRYMYDPAQVNAIVSWAEEMFGPVSIHNEGVLYLHKDSSVKFFDYISEWLPDAVEYKLPEEYRGIYNGWLNVAKPQLGRVMSTEEYVSNPKLDSHKYCITVDDTHTFFTRGGLVANCWIFDNPILERNGFVINGIVDDTLWMWHHTQPDSPASLQWVSSFFEMWGPWKQLASGEPELYGCCDVDSVQRIMAQLPRDLRTIGLWDSYVRFVREFHPILRKMQDRGVRIDLEKRAIYKKKEEEIIDRIEAGIQTNIPEILKKKKDYTIWPEVLRPLREKFLAVANAGIPKKKDHLKKFSQIPKELQEGLIAVATAEHPEYKWGEFDNEVRPYLDVPFNSRSVLQLKEYINYMAKTNPKAGYAVPKDLEGKETTAKKDLERLARKTRDRVLTDILELRRHQKVITTYVKGWKIAADSAVHTTFTFAPATWQLSSRAPNVQNCFPGYVEILTDQGWTRFDQLTDGTKVAQYDDSNEAISFVCPYEIIRQYYHGDLVQIATDKQLFITMTPDHECLVRNRRTKKFYKTPAENYPEDNLQYQAGQYVGGITFMPEAALIVIAALQADGYITKEGAISWRFTKSRKVTRLTEALSKLAIPYRTYKHKAKGQIEIFIERTKMPNWLQAKKFFGPWILELDAESFRFLADEIYFWDGLHNRMSMYSSSVKSNADWAQILAVLTGRRAKLREYWNGNPNSVINYQTDVTNRPYSNTTNHRKTYIPHDGMVYCVTVPTGNIVVRQLGKVMITGNCPKHGDLAKGFRECIVPSPGNLLIEADYKSAHALTLGFHAGDPDYMRLARLDCHSFVAAHLLKLPEAVSGRLIEYSDEDYLAWVHEFRANKKYKFVRDKQAKPTILGYGFGLGKKKLYDMNIDSFTSQAEAGKVIEMLDHLFPRTAAFRNEIRKIAHRQQYLLSPWGAIRRFNSVFVWNSRYGRLDSGKDSEKAIAFLPATAAFGKVREAMLDLTNEGLDEKYGMINTVHDSLVFNCPREFVDEAIYKVKEIMERPASVLIHPEICPNGLSIGVEVSVGEDWANLKEVRI